MCKIVRTHAHAARPPSATGALVSPRACPTQLHPRLARPAPQIPHIASLAAGLARYHPSLGVALVDEVLEQVEAGLEAPDAGTCWERGGWWVAG